MDNTKKLIGNNVRKFRLQKGYKQSELAELVGVEDKTISRIEVGGNYPSLDLLVRISNVLDKKLVDMVNFDDQIIETLSYFNENELSILKKFIDTLSKKIR